MSPSLIHNTHPVETAYLARNVRTEFASMCQLVSFRSLQSERYIPWDNKLGRVAVELDITMIISFLKTSLL